MRPPMGLLLRNLCRGNEGQTLLKPGLVPFGFWAFCASTLIVLAPAGHFALYSCLLRECCIAKGFTFAWLFLSLRCHIWLFLA